MTDTSPSQAEDGFASRVGDIHVPEPKADREALLLKLGGVLVAAGIVAILVAYFGASGTTVASEQIPYAISGGLIGLALVILGSALIIRFSLARLFRYWLARILYEHQVQTDRTVDALGRIEAVLAGPPVPDGTPPRVDAGHSEAARRTEAVDR